MTEEERRAHRKEYMRVWRAANQDRLREYDRKWKTLNPDKHYTHNRKWILANRPKERLYHVFYNAKRLWGCTKDFFETLMPRLNGPCEICGEMGFMHIDHCHERKQFRGLLCQGCNQGIGNFRDDPTRLQKAIVYLETHG